MRVEVYRTGVFFFCWYIFALYVTFLCCLFRAHWYLVVICFPGLAEPKTETWNGPNSQTGKNQSETDKLQDQEADQGSKSPNDNTETQPATSASNHSDQADTATGSLNCVCVCYLMMDVSSEAGSHVCFHVSEKTQEEPTKDAVPSPVVRKIRMTLINMFLFFQIFHLIILFLCL